MSARTKRIAVILSVQLLCVSVGMWMHHRLTKSSATRAIQEELWADFDTQAQELFAGISDAQWNEIRQGTISEDWSARAGRHSATRNYITIVDSQWQMLASTHRLIEPSTLQGDLKWQQAEGAPSPVGRFVYGYAQFPDGLHTAIRYELADGRGYGLLHADDAIIGQRVSQLLGSLPMISMLTIVWTCALLGIAVFMIVTRLYDEMDQHRSRSAADTLRQTHDLLKTRDAVIFGLAKLADSRDPETGDHLERISIYSTTLAAALRRHPQFRKEVTPGFVRLIGISSALHDIGKVGIEDRILLKPAKLTPTEYAEMQTHTRIGGKCLQEIEQRLGGSNFLQMAREIAYAHHENWDGTGYPAGLCKTQIPLAARIVAIADVYDALSSKRVYKDAMTHDDCVDIIRKNAGTKFDPDMVEVWLSIESRFQMIAKQLANQGQAPMASSTELHENESESKEFCTAVPSESDPAFLDSVVK